MEPRELLRQAFAAGLAAVHGRHCVVEQLRSSSLGSSTPVWLLAIGKAAAAMAQGVLDELGRDLERGLVITKSGHASDDLIRAPRVHVLFGGHPLPDERSLAAGQALVSFLREVPVQATLLVCLSGGASALIELLPDGINLNTLRQVNDWGLRSGIDIHDCNALRKAFSRIKGGRLLSWVGQRKTVVLAISDVPGDDPSVLGSGLLVPDKSHERLSSLRLPREIRALLAQRVPPLEADAVHFENIEWHTIGNNGKGREAAAALVRNAGWPVHVCHELISGDAGDVGRRLVAEMAAGRPGMYIWGGETTVRLPVQPGRGGRNQHLALAAALVMQGHADLSLLAGGTDGTDGPGDAAGAIVDGNTIARGTMQGFDAQRSLEKADSGRFLEASGDLLWTGPTGTNVMDLILGCKLAG